MIWKDGLEKMLDAGYLILDKNDQISRIEYPASSFAQIPFKIILEEGHQS